MAAFANGKFYRSFDDVMKERFGGKVYRLALSASHSCPNRDGTCGTGGCIFCSEDGSGDFAESAALSVNEQIERAKAKVAAKLSRNFAGYMAYFQSFTGTYGNEDYLIGCFQTAAAHPEVLALSIATRPDCISDRMLQALTDLNAVKPVSVELGLQTIHEDTAQYINRGYALPVFEDAFRRLKQAGLEVIVHIIVGLPGEDEERTRETVRYLAELKYGGMHIDGIKIQLLHILKNTKISQKMPEITEKFEKNSEKTRIFLNDGNFLLCYNLTNYADLVTELVTLLPMDIAVHRLTGDAPKKLLIQPLWTGDKKRVLNTITKTFQCTGRYQAQSFSQKRGDGQ